MSGTISQSTGTDIGLVGVEHRPLVVNKDDRGSFTDLFSTDWALGQDPVQWSMVTSAAGVFRGMHLHQRHDEYFSVISGRAAVGLYDAREGSETESRSTLVELDGSIPSLLSFPAGVIHGWYYRESTMHLQAVSESYATYGGDDNYGCHWSDPDLGIAWPAQPTIVSDRANEFGPLADLLRTVRVDA